MIYIFPVPAKTLAIVAAPTDSITAKSNIVGIVSLISHRPSILGRAVWVNVAVYLHPWMTRWIR